MTRSPKYTLAVLAVAALTTGVAQAPASATPDRPSEPERLLQMRYSATEPWADNLPRPLFTSDDGPLVPGDAVSTTFYVFNTPGTRALLSLTCTITGENPFAERLDLEYRVGGQDEDFRSCEGEPTPFEITGRTSQLVDVQMLFQNIVDEQIGDMDQSATYSITVTLSQAPPKGGGGKPQVLGAQTLPAPEDSGPELAAASTPTTSDSGEAADGPADVGPGPRNKSRTTPVRPANAAATLPEPNVGLTESVPLIGGLLITGALLAGFRRRRREAD